MQLPPLLKQMVKHEASDLYLTTGAPPSAKIHGKLKVFSNDKLMPNQVKEMAYELMSAQQIEEFEIKPEMNLAISEPQVGRFRVNIFKQRNQVAMVVRHIHVNIPKPETLKLPDVLTKLIMQKRGLILFVGSTGSGKSTSLASLIDYRNANSSGHIITIEDPIEFMHQHKKCIVNQREVGIDTDSFEDALKNTLRQAPDVIMIGEIRDRETMEHAIAFAETGHLAISTLHSNNANQAFDRIVNFFPDDRHNQVLLDLSLNTVAIVSQRLIPDMEGRHIAAFEVLVGTPYVRELILKGKFHELKDAMEKYNDIGMQTFDDSLVKLYLQGEISVEEAINNADSQNNVRLKISLEEDGGSISLFAEEAAEKELSIEELATSFPVIELAAKGEFDKIKQIVEQTLDAPHKSYDDVLIQLYRHNSISLTEVLQNANSNTRVKQQLGAMENDFSSEAFTLKPLDDD